MLTLLTRTGIVWPVPAAGPAPAAIKLPGSVTGTRSSAVQRDGKRLAGTSTGPAVRGRPVLRCSGPANHRDPVTPPNLPGGKPGSGPPPGRDVGSGLTWAGPPGSAARPKGDPP